MFIQGSTGTKTRCCGDRAWRQPTWGAGCRCAWFSRTYRAGAGGLCPGSQELQPDGIRRRPDASLKDHGPVQMWTDHRSNCVFNAFGRDERLHSPAAREEIGARDRIDVGKLSAGIGRILQGDHSTLRLTGQRCDGILSHTCSH